MSAADAAPREWSVPARSAPTRVMIGLAGIAYRRRATALHAARPLIGAAYCGAFVLLILAVSHPLILAGIVGALLAVGALTGASPSQRSAMIFALPFAVVIFLINALVSHHGLTVVARFGPVPLLGQLDITAESLAAGGALALRVVAIILCGVLGAVAIDPDGLLMAGRRWWPAAALTAALALRVVPVLARDGARLADARRCRPAGVPGAVEDRYARLLVMRSVTASVLDRASDLAATLELRGHGLRHRPARASAPWSRHDAAVAAAAVGLLAVAIVATVGGSGQMVTDPLIDVPTGFVPLGLAVAVPIVALLPLAARRGTAA